MSQDNYFGAYLRRLREAKGKTLRATAKVLTVSPQYLSDVELGNVSPFNPQLMAMLVDFLDLSVLEALPLSGLARLAKLERAIKKVDGE